MVNLILGSNWPDPYDQGLVSSKAELRPPLIPLGSSLSQRTGWWYPPAGVKFPHHLNSQGIRDKGLGGMSGPSTWTWEKYLKVSKLDSRDSQGASNSHTVSKASGRLWWSNIICKNSCNCLTATGQITNKHSLLGWNCEIIFKVTINSHRKLC